MKRNLTFAALLAAASLLPATAHADLKAELTKAYAHAAMASEASTIDKVHMHLHHVVNCLVGPKGQGYDASQLDPCKGDGNGAIPDSSSAGQKAKLEKAVTNAEAGIAATEFAKAVKKATDAERDIASAR